MKKMKVRKKEISKPLHEQIEDFDFAKPTGRIKQRVRADEEEEVRYFLGYVRSWFLLLLNLSYLKKNNFYYNLLG